MAYKFQLGAFRASGSIVVEDTFEADASTVDSLNVQNGGITNAGSIAGATSIDGSGDLTMGTITMSGFAVDADGDTALKSLLVDDSSTIGCDSDSDLLTLSDGLVVVAGELQATTLDIGGTNITATAAEINLIDGGASVGTTALASGDGFLHNDAGTMRMTSIDKIADLFAGDGLGASSAVLEVQVSGAIAIKSDKVALSSSIAGTGLTVSPGEQEGVVGSLEVDIPGLSALGGTGLHQTQDNFMFSDNGTLKRISFSNLEDAIFANVSSDATIAAGGALTIADNAVTLAKLAGITRGSIIVGDSSGDPSALALGSAGQIAVSDGDDLIYRSLSGDVTMAGNGAVTIANDAVEASMINDNAISGFADIGAAITGTDELLISDAGTLKRTDVSRLATLFAGDGLGANASSALDIAVSGAVAIKGGKVALSSSIAGTGLNLAPGQQAGVVGELEVDIAGLSALGGTGLHQTQDHFMFSDNGQVKRISFSNLEDAIFGNVSGEATIAAGGALTIANNAIVQSKLADDAVGADELAANAVVNASVASDAAIAASKIDFNVDLGGNITFGNQSDDVVSFGGGVTIGGDLTVNGTTTSVNSTTINVSSSFTFEGPADAHETTLHAGGDGTGDAPQADSTLYLPALAAGNYFIPAMADKATAASAAVTAAEFALLDGGSSVGTTALASGDGFLHNDNGTMRHTQVDKIADLFAGNGLSATSAVLALDVNGLSNTLTAIAQADLFALADADASNEVKKITFSNLEDQIFGNVSGDATIAAGGALTIAANAVEGSMLNNNIVSGLDDIGADIVNTDEMIVSDGGTIKRMDMSRLKTFIGNGTAAVANKDDGDTLAVGVNYFSNHGGAETATLPASAGLTVGESIKIKAGSDCSSTNTLTINRAGSQTIDGATSIVLESPFAAVELVYVAADTFRVF